MVEFHISSMATPADSDALLVAVVSVEAKFEVAPGTPLAESTLIELSERLSGLQFGDEPFVSVRSSGVKTATAPVVVFTHLGPADGTETFAPNSLRAAAGSATRAATGAARVLLAYPTSAHEAPHRSRLVQLEAMLEGAALGSYRFTSFRRRTAPTTPETAQITALVSPVIAGAESVLARVAAVTRAVAGTRDMVNTPANHLTPANFAEQAVQLAEGLPVSVEVLDESMLRGQGFGGILAVGQGSANPPRLVKLDYNPAASSKHIGLVGKGITFDTGGISLKPAAGMEDMKNDMAGAATVLHALIAIARLGLSVRVTSWLALAENMPSGTSQRPGDVISMADGTTVEVLNTDAEGRLVLADALVAAGLEKPDVLVDVATLTGAQVGALGERTGAILGNDEQLQHQLWRLSEAVDEPCWPLPRREHLRRSLRSKVADLANIGARWGGAIVAAEFLAEFVPAGDEHIPWAHLDIAGPAYNTGAAYGHVPAGATGAPIRTLIALARELTEG